MSYRLPSEGLTPEQRDAAEEVDLQEQINEDILNEAMSVNVHENLQEFRRKRKYKKSEMAEMMGVSARSYYMYEAGKRAIPSSALVQLEAFTRADLNEVLLGGTKAPDHSRTQFIVDEAIKALCFLGSEYQDMPMITKRQVIDELFRWQKGGQPAKPHDIVEAVKIVTRYKFHREDLPAPPFWEDYVDHPEAFELATAAWEKMVAEDFPPDEADKID